MKQKNFFTNAKHKVGKHLKVYLRLFTALLLLTHTTRQWQAWNVFACHYNSIVQGKRDGYLPHPSSTVLFTHTHSLSDQTRQFGMSLVHCSVLTMSPLTDGAFLWHWSWLTALTWFLTWWIRCSYCILNTSSKLFNSNCTSVALLREVALLFPYAVFWMESAGQFCSHFF